jgi:hypothetical protein
VSEAEREELEAPDCARRLNAPDVVEALAGLMRIKLQARSAENN